MFGRPRTSRGHFAIVVGIMRKLAIALAFLAATSVAAQTTKTQKVHQLLTLLRAGEMGVQVVDQMIGGLKESMPTTSDEFWKNFRTKVKATDLVDLLVPVYERNLDESDIDELLKFYSSPAGKHFIDKQSIILQESMRVGESWGEKIAQQAIEELSKKKD